jgi:hypothetical protein
VTSTCELCLLPRSRDARRTARKDLRREASSAWQGCCCGWGRDLALLLLLLP